MTQRRTLDPELDVVFTMLFGAEKNRDILVAFLTAVLAPTCPIQSIELLSERPEPSNIDDKRVVLDLRVRFASGEQVDVEMQNEGHPGVRKRALYYWARGELLTDDHELQVLELPKLQHLANVKGEPADVLWGKFFAAKTDLEREQLAMQEPALKRAKEALVDLSDDPSARAIAEKRETNLRMYYLSLATARKEAVAEATPERAVTVESVEQLFEET